MEIKSRVEQLQWNKTNVNKHIYFLELTKDEFYLNLESNHLESLILEKFKELLKTHVNENSLALIVNKEITSRISKYMGIWRELAKEGISFLDSYLEIESNGVLSGLAFVAEDEMLNIFKHKRWIIVIGNQDKIKDIYFKNPQDKNKLIKTFLFSECTIVEYVDLGYDGKILSFIKKI